jgi:hypothetical protein
VSRRITLIDADRPEEPLEVEIVRLTATVLVVTVPGTSVSFELSRLDAETPFEGSLGGRQYRFTPKSRRQPPSAS